MIIKYNGSKNVKQGADGKRTETVKLPLKRNKIYDFTLTE